MTPQTTRRRERLGDLLLALLTVLAMCAAPASVGAPVTWEGSFALGMFLGGLLAARRRRPLLVLGLSSAVIIVYQCSGLFEGGWVWPMTVALFTAALTRPYWSATIGAVTLAFGVAWQWQDLSEMLPRGGVELLWLALVMAAANSWRQYARWRAEHAARLLQLEQTRLAEQRLTISREVHDVIAHTLAVVGIHLNVAAEALTDSPEEARAAIDTAMQVRGQAMTDLKAFVGDLRDHPQPGLDAVPAVLDQARAAGLTVSYRPAPHEPPAPVALTAYRVIQEAVVNTLRHADATHLSVDLSSAPGELHIHVADDGRSGAGHIEGHGLTGMRERVAAMGGTLRISAETGFTVHVMLPDSSR
ncbi:histidine kinase [Nonomuraea sp. NBC_01738]|uniref:sensor histidine kinase n=1 Tax=Nonomuraea sp. NBC_01738 TaxID=2976003 RepID=UPI002E0D63C1|nr:histidine kinase [Nonomuraea sp. NBC_01738]